jgi:hypothetical protein
MILADLDGALHTSLCHLSGPGAPKAEPRFCEEEQ